MVLPAFQSVQYINPFAPLPLGTSQAGVVVNLTGAAPPQGNVAYAQLLADQVPMGWGTGASAISVTVVNTVPLAPEPSYIVQVQYAAAGQDPQNLDWSDPAVVASAPVVAQQSRLAAATVTPSGLTVTCEPPSGATLPGAYVQLIDGTAGSLTGKYYLGTAQIGAIAAAFIAGHDYLLNVSAVQSVSGSGSGSFAAPFTIGASTTPQPIPTSAPAIASVTFDGTNVAVKWSAPAIPSNAPVPRYEVLLLDGGNIVASAAGGASGGQIVTGAIAALASPQVAARMSYGDFVGPAGASVALYGVAPTVTAVAVAPGAAITAQLSSPGALPSGGALVATLYTNGVAGATQTLSGATGSVSWSSITVDANSVYAIDAALVVTNNSQTSTGPRSPRLTVPLTAPQAVVSNYDGRTVVVDLAFAARDAVSGYAVALTAAGATTIAVNAGSGLPISFPADLDVTKAWSASVTPVLGIVTAMASGASTVALPTVTAPALTAVVYDGTALTLQWSAAVLPFLTGYRINVSNGPMVIAMADQTSCTIPLTLAQASGASVTVTGISPLRDTAASAAVAILSGVIQVSSVTVGSSVVATWSASPAPPAVRAELLIGDGVAGMLTGATAIGVTFAAPTPATQPYRLRARAVSADGVAAGPASLVDLILTAPVFTSGYLGGGQLSLSWDPVNPFGVTSYVLAAAPASGTAESFSVTGSAYEGVAPAAFLTAGTLTITPKNARCTGPAASVAIHGAGSFTTGTYDGRQLSVTATLGVVGGTDTFWLDVLIDGALAARQVLVQSTTSPITNPLTVDVAIPRGASAAVRLSDVGPGTLGPASAPAPIPTVAPTLALAAYDGARLHVSWQPTPGPGIDGYVVSVTGASPAIADTYVAGADSFAAAITAALTYPFDGIAVSIRAASGSAGAMPYIQGPASLALPPILAANIYSVAVAAAGYPPYLYRRGEYQTLADVQNKPIVLYLPKPFSDTANPTVPSTGTPTFQLAPSPEGSELAYQLTIGTAAWSTLGADPVRTSLQQEYVQFLSDVETAVVFPWAIGLVRQLIAEAMPQTFEEVLYYRYGLWRDDSSRTVDLTPGTRLQLSNALYQSIVGGTSPKNGFLALGNETMEIVDVIPQGGAGTLPAGSARSLSVDAFLSLFYPGGGTADSGRPVAAGPIDFFDDQNRQAYYRLFYPPNFMSSGSNGSTALTDNVALIGTTSWATMATITQQYSATGTFPTNIEYFATYFRGRTSLSPLINVSVQGEPRWVVLGTSVRQLLATQGLAPLYGGKGGDALAMLRAAANLFLYPSLDAGLSLDAVQLGNADLGAVVPLYWPLDMPVVGGDQISLRQL